jgi:hypothetical protein
MFMQQQKYKFFIENSILHNSAVGICIVRADAVSTFVALVMFSFVVPNMT